MKSEIVIKIENRKISVQTTNTKASILTKYKLLLDRIPGLLKDESLRYIHRDMTLLEIEYPSYLNGIYLATRLVEIFYDHSINLENVSVQISAEYLINTPQR